MLGQLGQDGLGQAGAGAAVGAGVGRARGQAGGDAPGQQAGDGLAAGVVGVEDLGEEGPQGGGGGPDAVAEEVAKVTTGAVDEVFGQVLGEGESGLGEQVLSGGGDLAQRDQSGRVAHETASGADG